jgi:hypothetical protein
MDVAIARFNVTLNSGLPDPWQVEAQ